MIRFLKDPLTHFLLAGLAMFWVYNALNPGDGEDNPTRIVVDRPALLQFLQFRTRAFEPERANAMLDAMGPQELDTLIRDYVREEALSREATALGLDKSDYVIKRRLVQTVEFVVGNATTPDEVDDKAVERYFTTHQTRYAVPASVTFTHVFFDAGRDGKAEAAKRAAEAFVAMNERHVVFSDAPGRGDRFPYNLNYVDQSKDAVAGHFGLAFTDRVFALAADEARWQGPLESAYGSHLVMLTARQDETLPPLAELRDRVREDYLSDLATERREALIEDIIGRYTVEVAVDGYGAAKAATQ